MKHRQIRKPIRLVSLLLLLATLPGCGINVVQDDYALELGVEVVPCIQTLAHLGSFLQWNRSIPIRDQATVLLCDDEDAYAFIEAEIKAMRSNFRSRRIHIGMDEAASVGLGRYYSIHGAVDRFDLLTRHMKRVTGLCRKHGFEPMLWSDMFFRLASAGADYYDPKAVVPQEALANLPEAELCYWDYEHTDPAHYEAISKPVSTSIPQIRRDFAGRFTNGQRYLECALNAGFGFTDGVDRRLTGCFGFSGGLTIENGLGLGVFFSGFQTTREEDSRLADIFDDCEFCFRGYYGGVYGEHIFLRKSFFYVDAGARFGMGGVNYSNHTVEDETWNYSSQSYDVTYQKADKCFVMALEPFGGINFLLNDHLTLSAGVEYRNLFFTSLHCDNVHIASGSDLNGLVYLVKIKFWTNF